MLTWCIIIGGCWWAAASLRNGWWLLLMVPAVAVLAAAIAALVSSFLLQDDLGRAAFAAVVQAFWGLLIGAIVAGVVRWRRRTTVQASLSREGA